MQRDSRAYLWDVREAAQAIQAFLRGLDATAWASNELVKATGERKFEVTGEALNQLEELMRCSPHAYRTCRRSRYP